MDSDAYLPHAGAGTKRRNDDKIFSKIVIKI